MASNPARFTEGAGKSDLRRPRHERTIGCNAPQICSVGPIDRTYRHRIAVRTNRLRRNLDASG